MNPSQLMPQPVSGAHEELAAFRLISVAEMLRMIPRTEHGGADRERGLAAVVAFHEHGVGRAAAEHVSNLRDAGNIPEMKPGFWERTMESIESSPMPEQEWEPLLELLGDEILGKLTGVSDSSMRRYRIGERKTPDEVAVRLHFTALIVADLLGSYNAFGVRRWFGRPRAQLHGAAPLETLEPDWTPEDSGPQAIRELAAALLAPLAS